MQKPQVLGKFRAIILSTAFALTLANAHQPSALAKADEEALPKAQSFAGAYLAGRSAERNQNFVAAIDYYEQAIGLDPESEIVLQRLFLSRLIASDMDEALELAEDVADNDLIKNVVSLTRATEAVRAKEYKAAIKLLDVELQGDLDRLLSGIMTGWAEFGAGDMPKALETIEALEGPQWFELFQSLASGYISILGDDMEAASAFLQKAIDDREGGAAARDTYVRGLEAFLRYAVKQGDAEKTKELMGLYENIAAQSPVYLRLKATIEKGETPKNLINSPQEGVAEILHGLAMAIDQPGAEAFVARFLAMAQHLRPNSDIVAFERADTFEQLGLEALAAAEWQKIGEKSPIWRLAQTRLSIVLENLEESDAAKEKLQRAIALEPTDIGPYLVLGRMHARKKDYRSAATLYDDAIAKSVTGPQLWNIYYQRGIAYERLKEWEKAEPNFREALKRNPTQPHVMNYLGYSLIDMDHDLIEGLELVRKAVDLAPDDGAIADSLGWAYYKLGRFDEAVDQLERAIRLLPGDPVINDHLGDAYWVVGRENEARFQWSLALDMDPEPEERAKIQKKRKEGLKDIPFTAAKTEEGDENSNEPSPEAPQNSDTEKDDKALNAAPRERDIAVEASDAPTKTGLQSVPDFHTVKAGQSLWTIAKEALGAGTRYPEIMAINPLLQNDPTRIFPGQRLKMPR